MTYKVPLAGGYYFKPAMLPNKCAKHGRTHAVTCGGCNRTWCEGCDPAPSALCPFCNGYGYSKAELTTK